MTSLIHVLSASSQLRGLYGGGGLVTPPEPFSSHDNTSNPWLSSRYYMDLCAVAWLPRHEASIRILGIWCAFICLCDCCVCVCCRRSSRCCCYGPCIPPLVLFAPAPILLLAVPRDVLGKAITPLHHRGVAEHCPPCSLHRYSSLLQNSCNSRDDSAILVGDLSLAHWLATYAFSVMHSVRQPSSSLHQSGQRKVLLQWIDHQTK